MFCSLVFWWNDDSKLTLIHPRRATLRLKINSNLLKTQHERNHQLVVIRFSNNWSRESVSLLQTQHRTQCEVGSVSAPGAPVCGEQNRRNSLVSPRCLYKREFGLHVSPPEPEL